MNRAIVDSINNTVQAKDTLYFLGDWSFGGIDNVKRFRDQVMCRNIHLIYGNHDKNIERSNDLQQLFTSCSYYKEITINRKRIILSHYSMRVWNKSHHGSWMLYGHSHHTLPDLGGKTIDIGWCKWRKPLSFEEIERIMDKRPINFIDHHSTETAE
jgi:calcineurin-like phosphoesterase family protein